jgi:vesicle-associated membrane protein 7
LLAALSPPTMPLEAALCARGTTVLAEYSLQGAGANFGEIARRLLAQLAKDPPPVPTQTNSNAPPQTKKSYAYEGFVFHFVREGPSSSPSAASSGAPRRPRSGASLAAFDGISATSEGERDLADDDTDMLFSGGGSSRSISSVSGEDCVVYLTMADQAMGYSAPFAFLADVQRRFKQSYGAHIATAGSLAMNDGFQRVLQDRIDFFSKNGAYDRVSRVQSEIESTKTVMISNLDKVINRGEKIEELVDKTDDLSSHSVTFKRKSVAVRKKMWWQNFKMKIVLACLCCVLIAGGVVGALFFFRVGPFGALLDGGSSPDGTTGGTTTTTTTTSSTTGRPVTSGPATGPATTTTTTTTTTAVPTTGRPTTGIPTTGIPTTGIPTTGVPTTGVPTTGTTGTTGIPTTGVPTTGVPTTGIPTTGTTGVATTGAATSGVLVSTTGGVVPTTTGGTGR